MLQKQKTIHFNVDNVKKLIENIPIENSQYYSTVTIYFMQDTLLFPNKPKYVPFSFKQPKNSTSDFQDFSFRLAQDLKDKFIYQYEDSEDLRHHHNSICIVNCSSKKIKFNKVDVIGNANLFLNKTIEKLKNTNNDYKTFQSNEKSITHSISNNSNYTNSYSSYSSGFSSSSSPKNSTLNKSNPSIKSKSEKNNEILNDSNQLTKNKSINYYKRDSLIEENKKQNINQAYNWGKIKKISKAEESKLKPDINESRKVKKTNNTTIKNNSNIEKSKDSNVELEYHPSNNDNEDSILNFDFEDNYLEEYKKNNFLGKKIQLKKDLENLSERYTIKSNDLYNKLKDIKMNCFSNKGIKKKKISAKNVERLLNDLIIQKKEENRFMKSELIRIWKKIDLIDN